jgi:hypothetical protein
VLRSDPCGYKRALVRRVHRCYEPEPKKLKPSLCRRRPQEGQDEAFVEIGFLQALQATRLWDIDPS